jgi:hypothetical protein
MAKEPTGTNADGSPKKRKGGARTKKDKVVILMVRGANIDPNDIKVVLDPWEAMELKEADAAWTMKKVTIPVKRAAVPNQGATQPA